MGKQFNTRIQHKIDTYENWNKAENFIPLEGELIIYTTNESGANETKIKIGDGKTLVKDLKFAAGGSASEEADTNAIQSDWAQADNTQLDYIKNKPGDKIIEEVKETLAELDVDFSGYEENIIPGLYVWSFNINENVEYNNGDKIVLKILPDNIILEANLYTDENADNAFGVGNNQTGHYATFNLNSDDILIAYSNGFMRENENIPYGIGINVLKKENPEDNTYSLFIVSAENNLENKVITLEVINTQENYIKLSNNALNIDSEPIENSNNLITSGTIYNYFSNLPKIQLITWEDDD